MQMFRLTEIWDNIAYLIYNAMALLRYIFFDRFRYGRYLKKSKTLKDRHLGKRCFIVLNGPSIAKHDLTKIKDEITMCCNYFYLSNYIKDIAPNYYCIWDSDTFREERRSMVFDLMKQCQTAEFIFNKIAIPALSEKQKNRTYFVYGQHMPNALKVRTNLAGISSSFTNVSAFMILCALYMGCKEIYVLGNDFAPGGNVHCYEKTHAEMQVNMVYKRKNKLELCAFHWSYYLAHLQSFYIDRCAQKQGAKIFNLNPDSYIRAYDFADYNEVIAQI